MLTDKEKKELWELTDDLSETFDSEKAERFQRHFGELSLEQRWQWNAYTLEVREKMIEKQRELYGKELGL